MFKSHPFKIVSLLWALSFVMPLQHSAAQSEGKIAFYSNRDGNWEVYVMNADGSNSVNLTNHAADDGGWGVFDQGVGHPKWSPDGSKILFVSQRDGNYEIYVMNADGSNQVRLTDNSVVDGFPNWSPDGSKILFDSNTGVYIMDADGTNPVLLTGDSISGMSAWSPDGSKFATEDWFKADNNSEIFVRNADGSDPVNLTQHFDADFAPSWSPDGRQIAFRSSRVGNPEIYVMGADGTNLVRLTQDSGFGRLKRDELPSWSPDGSKILFSSLRDGNWEVYVMNVDGSDPVNLTNHSGDDILGSWTSVIDGATAIEVISWGQVKKSRSEPFLESSTTK